MSKRSKPRRRPFTVSVMGETVTLNKSSRQGYLLLADPERGGAKVRCYVGRLLKPGVLPEQATRADVEPAALEEAGAPAVGVPCSRRSTSRCTAFASPDRGSAPHWLHG